MPSSELERALAAWEEAATFVTSEDRAAFAAGAALRRLIVEHAHRLDEATSARSTSSASRKNDRAKDFFGACLHYGRVLADSGASATLAAAALDGLLLADAARSAAARAAALEGYVSAVRDQVERALIASYEPPRCFVLLDDKRAAVVTSHPSTESDVHVAWAARVTGALLVRGVREVIVDDERAPAAAPLLRELGSAGVAVLRRG